MSDDIPKQAERKIYPDAEQVAQAAASWFAEETRKAVTERGRCLVALSGGSTPKRLFQILADLPPGSIPWQAIHLLWGDERNVPPDHPDSNYKMTKEALLDRLPDPKPHVYRIPTGEQTPQQAALEYDQTLLGLKAHMDDQSAPLWDIVFLGLGDDAHTASLFPETKALEESDRLAIENEVPKLNTTRITLTAPCLNAARKVAFLVCGENKRWALEKIMGTEYAPKLYPAQLIRPSGNLTWFLDQAAAG